MNRDDDERDPSHRFFMLDKLVRARNFFLMGSKPRSEEESLMLPTIV